jgi:ubiquinol-cytochrome c reductase iron-sulfur subunit
MAFLQLNKSVTRVVSNSRPFVASSFTPVPQNNGEQSLDIHKLAKKDHETVYVHPSNYILNKNQKFGHDYKGFLSPAVSQGITSSSWQVRFVHTDMVTPNFDHYRHKDVMDPTSQDKGEARKSAAYAVTGACLMGIGIAAKNVVHPTIRMWSPAKNVMAVAKSEINLASIPPGKNATVKWRGKPLFVRHRTAAEIAAAENVDISQLRDPEHDKDRVKDPEWLVVLGICTHLGCVPIANQGLFNGYYCPCHGSHYDTSGRIRQGPAPLNLEVPNYEFEGDQLIVG